MKKLFHNLARLLNKVKRALISYPLFQLQYAKNTQDRLFYSEIIQVLNKNESMMDISKRTSVTGMTIYNIKEQLNYY